LFHYQIYKSPKQTTAVTPVVCYLLSAVCCLFFYI
jgi:hypothetical protein